jgi:hypothetical protein
MEATKALADMIATSGFSSEPNCPDFFEPFLVWVAMQYTIVFLETHQDADIFVH